MGLIEKFIPKEDRTAALLLYGMLFSLCFNGKVDCLVQNKTAWLTN